MFKCKSCPSLEASKSSLERENLLLRTQLSDLLDRLEVQAREASIERQQLVEQFIDLLNPARRTSKDSSRESAKNSPGYFPGSRPDLRPPDPLMLPKKQAPQEPTMDLPLLSE